LLLERGAKVSAENKYGNPPLWTAVFESNGRGELIALLLGQGADPHKPNKAGRTPLELAHMIANYDVAQFFKKYDQPGAK
jgi:ankyrin repeat protein